MPQTISALFPLAALVLTTGGTVACGGDHAIAPSAVHPDSGASDTTADADAPTIGSPGAAVPCAHKLKTGYSNDDLCLEAPPEDVGFQLHFGPSNYDDPVDVGRFLLKPGDEGVLCGSFTTPNTDQKPFVEYHARLRRGSHHMITYALTPQVQASPDGTIQAPPAGPAGCSLDPANYHFLIGAQAALSPAGGIEDRPVAGETAPEDLGIASQLDAQTKTVVEMHYVNTGEESILREGWINIIYADPSQVTAYRDPIVILGGLNMKIDPFSKQTVTSTGCGLTKNQPDELRLMTLIGHTHALTEQMRVYADRLDGTHELIYQTNDWQSASEAQFNTVEKNPPLGSPKTDGAYTGLLTLKRGESLSWECDVNNTLATPVIWDNQAYTAEMCNLFGFVTPGIGTPWTCYRP